MAYLKELRDSAGSQLFADDIEFAVMRTRWVALNMRYPSCTT